MSKLIIFFVILSASTLANALELVGNNTQKIIHLNPSFNTSITLKNTSNKYEIISYVTSSKSRCMTKFSKAPIQNGETTKININCSSLPNGFYQVTFKIHFINEKESNKFIEYKIFGEAVEENCGDVDLDRKGGSMEHVTVRNQEQTRTCIFQTIATASDAIRFSRMNDKDFNKKSSGVELALSYHKYVGDGGFPEGKVNVFDNVFEYIIQRNGTCDENSLPAIASAKNQGQLHQIFKEVRESKVVRIDDNKLNDYYIKISNILKTANVKTKKNFKKIDLETYLVNERFADFMEDYIGDISCTKKINISSTYKLVSDLIYPINEIKRKLNSDKSLPVLGLLSTKFFKKEESHFFTKWQTNHAVMFTGKRRNPITKKCEIKIRNSWGMKKSYENPKLTVIEKEGSFWVEEDTLRRFLGQTYSFY